jgi:protein-tyrosine phosphatase
MLASLSMDGSPALVASADASPVDVAVQGLEQVLEQMDALSLGPAVDLDAVDEDLEVEEDSEDEPVLTGNEPRRGLLYLGGWKVSYGAWCRVNNIKFILCCARTKDIEAAGTDSRRRRWHSDSKQLEREGVAFHRLPWADHARQRLWSNRPFDQLAEAVLKLHQALARGDNCLVHCRKGRSRSATVVAAYLMARRGLGRTDAINWIRARRPSAGPNSGFMQQLLDLQRSPVIAYLRERVGVAALEDRQRYLERKARERRDRKERHGEKAHHGHRHRNRVAERAAAAAGSALGGVAEAAAVVVVDEQPAAVAVAE